MCIFYQPPTPKEKATREREWKKITNPVIQNILTDIKHNLDSQARVEHNKSFLPKLGERDFDEKDELLTIIETCESFRLQHESDGDDINVYTDDEAFPDNHRHIDYLYHRQIAERELDWQRIRTKKATNTFRNQITKFGGLKKLMEVI